MIQFFLVNTVSHWKCQFLTWISLRIEFPEVISKHSTFRLAIEKQRHLLEPGHNIVLLRITYSTEWMVCITALTLHIRKMMKWQHKRHIATDLISEISAFILCVFKLIQKRLISIVFVIVHSWYYLHNFDLKSVRN